MKRVLRATMAASLGLGGYLFMRELPSFSRTQSTAEANAAVTACAQQLGPVATKVNILPPACQPLGNLFDRKTTNVGSQQLDVFDVPAGWAFQKQFVLTPADIEQQNALNSSFAEGFGGLGFVIGYGVLTLCDRIMEDEAEYTGQVPASA